MTTTFIKYPAVRELASFERVLRRTPRAQITKKRWF